MKNLTLILLLTFSILSCNSNKDKPDNIKDIQQIFNIKGNVKEIQKKIVTKDFYFFSITTFDRDGNPIETTQYDKTGKLKSTEPWIKVTAEDLKQTKLKNEYDSKHRLVKQIEYHNGDAAFETQYKYTETGNKAEEIRKFGDRNIQSLYDSNGHLKEVIISIVEDDKLYPQGKEKYIYNKNQNLIEKQDYRYNENKFSVNHLYKYDKMGSLIKTTTYYTDSKTPEIENRKIIYY